MNTDNSAHGENFFGSKMTRRHFLTIRKAIWGLLLVLLLALGWHLPTLRAKDDRVAAPPTPRLLPVDSVRLAALPSYQTVRAYTGQITARRSSDLGFERVGTLHSLAVDDGERVEQGATLATLDTQTLRTTRRQLQAQRAQAVAQLQELRAGPRQETIATACAQLHEQRAELALAAQRRSRRQRLWKEGVVAREEFDAAEATFNVWQARFEAAQRRLDELMAGIRPEQLAAQEALVAQFDARLAAVNLDLQKSVLHAPFAGTIAARLVDEGTVVAAGQPLVRLVEDTHLEVRVGVPPQVAAKLTVGDTLRVQVGASKLSAHITARLPELDAMTRTVTVVLTLPAPQAPGVVPGQVARLQLVETVASPGFWLPITALTKGERGLWSCLALIPVSDDAAAGFRVEPRSVEILHTENNRVFVRGLLQAGEHVVKSGTHRIVAGQRVQPIS